MDTLRRATSRANTVVMMARAPWVSGKTRLTLDVDPSAHSELRLALFLDTLDVVISLAGAHPVVACEPREAVEQMREIVGATVDVIPQRGRDLGERLAHASQDAFSLGAASVVLIGSDLPDLPARLLVQAFARLAADGHGVVLGPATDGGYYLIGMNQPHRALFEGIDWGTDRAYDQTLAAARKAGLPCALLDTWADVDHARDLARLAQPPGAGGAVRTREWLRTVVWTDVGHRCQVHR